MLDPKAVIAIESAIRRAEIVCELIDPLRVTREQGVEAARVATDFDRLGDCWAAELVERGAREDVK